MFTISENYKQKSNLTITVDKFEKKLIAPCFLCFENFDNLVSLKCGHMFCFTCLHEYSEFESQSLENVNEEKTFVCPVCEKKSKIIPRENKLTTPDIINSRKQQLTRVESGVILQRCDSCVFRGQTEIASLYCSKCSLNLCRACVGSHDVCKVFEGHKLVHVSNKDNLSLYCEIHSKMSCMYYCICCRSSACPVCVLHYHTESKHNVVVLKELLEQAASQLKSLIKDFDSKKQVLVFKCERLISQELNLKPNNCESNVPQKKVKEIKKSESVIRGGFQQLLSSISITHPQSPQSAPPSNSNRFTIGKVSELDEENRPASESDIANDIDSISFCSEEMNSNSLTYKSALNILKQKIHLTKKNGKTPKKDLSINLLKVDTENLLQKSVKNQTIKIDVSYIDVSLYVTTDDQNFASKLQRCFDAWSKLDAFCLSLMEMPDTKKLYTYFDDAICRVKVVLDSIVRIEKDLDNRLHLKQERLNEAGCPANNMEVESVNNCLKTSRNGKVSIRVKSSKSLKSLLVSPKILWKYEKPKIEISESLMPSALASVPNGEMTIVAEYDSLTDANNRLSVLDIAGRYVGCIVQGSIQPLGVAITREGYIAVTDGKGKRIKILNSNGQLMSELGKGHFGWPFGIATNSRGQIVVSDAFNDNISIFTTEGKKLRSFGSTGSGKEQLRNPYSVAIDRQDRIVVSDCGNNCIKIFDINGGLISCLSEFEINVSKPRRLSAINNLQTNQLSTEKPTSPSDTQNSKIVGLAETQLGKSSGSTDLQFGERKQRRRKLKLPRGVATDLDSNIYVADEHARVGLFNHQLVFQRLLLAADQEEGVQFPEALCCTSDGEKLIVSEWNASSIFAVKCYQIYN